MIKNISQSQINLFKHCPYAYALRYIHKKEGIWFDPSIIEVGSRVHDAIDIYYKNYYLANGTEEQIKNQVYEILRNKWTDNSLPAKYLQKAYTCVCNFAKFEKHMLKGRRMKPLTEVKIYNDGLMGIVDYLDLNTPKIVDFKTNTRAGVGYNEKIQAVMYKILIKKEYDIDLPYFTLQYLFPGETRVVKYDNKVMEVEADLYNNIEYIKGAWDSKMFPKKPRTPKACNSCQYNYYCGGV